MIIAFHFNADSAGLGHSYGKPIREAIFSCILDSRSLDLHSKIFQGDVLLRMYCSDTHEINNGVERVFNPEKFVKTLNELLNPTQRNWSTFTQDNATEFANSNVFVIVIESISYRDGIQLDEQLVKIPSYLGALQVDCTSKIHWLIYQQAMIPAYRLIRKQLYLFWDGACEDSKDNAHLEELKTIGFDSVKFESLNNKFTIFDGYSNFEQARRVAELSGSLENMLGFLADQVITRLSDTAPKISDKLWSALRTFDQAETFEHYAQVATSCRRIIEYVADCIFPPIENSNNKTSHKLGKDNYRNRILAFADQRRLSNTNIDLICVSTENLSKQIEKLTDLTNKGTHSEIHKNESRRCVLRTLMLLDDLISLKIEAFEIKVM